MARSFDYTLFMMCPYCKFRGENTKSPCPGYEAMSNYNKKLNGINLKLYLYMNEDGIALCRHWKEKRWVNPAATKAKEESEKLQGNLLSMGMTLEEDSNTVGHQETLM